MKRPYEEQPPKGILRVCVITICRNWLDQHHVWLDLTNGEGVSRVGLLPLHFPVFGRIASHDIELFQELHAAIVWLWTLGLPMLHRLAAVWTQHAILLLRRTPWHWCSEPW